MIGNTFVVAKEGWKYIGILLGLFVLFLIMDADLLEFLAFAGAAAAAYIYRNPERVVPYYQNGSIVALADGKVKSIETVDEGPLLEGPCYKLTIESSCLDTTLLRAPMNAHVTCKEVRRGNRLNASAALAGVLNEKALLKFTDATQNSVVVDHLLEQSIDGISVYVQQDQKVNQGSRYGQLLKGTHTIYLPEKSRVAVKVGEHLRAGETLLAYFA